MKAKVGILLSLTCAIICAQTGCVSLSSLMGLKRESIYDTTMLKAQGYSIPPGGMPRALPDSVKLNGTEVVLEIRGDESKIAAIPLESDATTIEDLVRKLELNDSLGAIQASIMRPAAGSPPVRLDVQLNGKGRVSNPSQNYALRPGDHIIAYSDGRTLFERFIDRQVGRD